MNTTFTEDGEILIKASGSTENYALVQFQRLNPELISLGCVKFEPYKKGEGGTIRMNWPSNPFSRGEDDD